MTRLRVIIAGRGVQGLKRQKICGSDFVDFVDPFSDEAKYKYITDVPLESYDAVLGCIPDEPKKFFVEYCLAHNKHVLVEKPFWVQDASDFEVLQRLANKTKTVCYTAYNHRFEPHFINMNKLIKSGDLGKIYRCRMFYGNGTARLVRDSKWRDQGGGVLPDLGSHLIDTVKMWFGDTHKSANWKIISSNCFENKSPDHVVIGLDSEKLVIELEMTMLMWRNHFTCDILAEKGSAHIESLCKWGPSKFIHRQRVFPSGRPVEHCETIVSHDPTWEDEYRHFKALISSSQKTDFSKEQEIFGLISRLENKII